MLSDSMKLYWGDAHTNIRPYHVDRLQESFAAARELLDFWPIAYYAFELDRVNGARQETVRQRPQFLDHWQTLCTMTASQNEPGRFICFPGYEWHGDRVRWGDHNIFYPTDNAPLDDAETLVELYQQLRKHDGLAIPHHTAYQKGERGKDWSVLDDKLSPFAEIFSSHGCSEGYGSPKLMDSNIGMGPMSQSGSIQEALAQGIHVGIMASGDLHAAYPMEWGKGLMACYAEKLTRPAIWDSFHCRRVYGVTGDRIKLDFALSELEMGSIGRSEPPYRVRVKVEGSDALSRIELLENNSVIRSKYIRYGLDHKRSGPCRYKFRCFFGWGPRQEEHGDVPDRQWDVRIELENGILLDIEKLWMRFGQRIEDQSSSGCRFHLVSGPGTTAGRKPQPFPGMVFDIRGTQDTRVALTVNGKPHRFTLGEARRFPAIISDDIAAENFMKERYNISPAMLAADDYDVSVFYHAAYKTHVWPAVREDEFSTSVEWDVMPDRDGESWYYVRVIQNNGQVAWSSPIWVTPKSI